MGTLQNVFTSSKKRILEMLVIGQMSLTVNKCYIPKILMTVKDFGGKKITLLERTVQRLFASGVYKKNGVNTRELVKAAISKTMSEFFDFRCEKDLKVAV